VFEISPVITVKVGFFSIFSVAHNYRCYGHLAVTVSRDVPFEGASLSQSDKVNARAIHDSYRDAGMHVNQ